MLTGAMRCLQINRVGFLVAACVVELQLRSVGGSGGEASKECQKGL